MRFTVLCAADLYSNKVNLEFTFNAVPTLPDLFRVVETTFAVESSALRPSGHPFIQFKVARFHVFDEKTQQWTELFNASQLSDFCQVYAFQKEVVESQKQIPPPRLPTSVRLTQAGSNSPTPRAPSNGATVNGEAPFTSSSIGRGQSPPNPATPRSPMRDYTPRSTVIPPTVASNSSVTQQQAFPENPTFDQKIRIVFDETDVNKNRLIELDEFRRITRLLNVDLNATAVADLFQRADQDRDGVLSISDFQMFGANYPTLLDSLYFRAREFWEDNRRRQGIELRRHAVEEARAREAQAANLAKDARNDLLEQEKMLADQERDLQQKLLRERDVRTQNLDTKKELEKQQYERAERERDALHGKEREQRRLTQAADAAKTTESAEKRVQSQEAELSRAQEKEKQLEILLADARRETARHAKALSTLGEELAQVREREQQSQRLVLEAQQELRKLQELVAAADVELGYKIDKDREVDNLLVEAQRETARSAHRRDEEERALQMQRDREAQHQKQHIETARGVEEAEKALALAEQEYQEYATRRVQVEQQELPLIEQEIRLREQRYNLEQMENRLKNEAMTFQAVTGRSLPSPSGASGNSLRTYSPTRR